MSPKEESISVLIIGAGVVGLSASLFLAQHGVKSIVVERHQGTSIHPRARSVNARTMEMFRGLGIANHVREAGTSISASSGMFHATSLKEVIEARPREEGGKKNPIAGLMDSLSPSAGTFVTQDMLEPVLVDEARRRMVDVRFYTDCVSVAQDENSVTALLRNRDSGESSNIRADYVIAADGAKSPIRSQLQVATTGRGRMGHLLNIFFSADLKDLVRDREFSLCVVERPEVVGVFTSINNSDRWVFHLHYDPSKGDTADDYTPERCKDLLRLALGIPDIDIDIRSILPWEPSVRIAERLKHGRIFLAGDSAHQMPPYAGQGANSGIADVHNLSWKLAAVLQGRANSSLLETYDSERLQVGREAAEISAGGADGRGLPIVKRNWKFFYSVWQRVFIVAGFGYGYDNSRAICDENTWPMGGYTWRPWTLPSLMFAIDGRPGRRVPHVWVEHENKRISTLDVCVKNFVLLAGSDGCDWTYAAKKVTEALAVDIDTYCVGPEVELKAPAGVFEAAACITSRGALLVRPDGFVAWRERRQLGETNKAQFEKAVSQALFLN